jgi:two-component system, OmpR family, response regulator RpaA
MPTILLIDKGSTTLDAVRQMLPGEVRDLAVADTLESALHRLGDMTPSLIVVDLGLKPSDSSMMCRRLRSVPRFVQVPILAVTSAQSAAEIARVLDSGADDCIRKPLVMREFGARMRALLRRPKGTESYLWITINRQDRSVHLRDEPVELTPTEFELLEALCRTPGEPMPASTLLQEVWHYPPGIGDPALVRNHVRNLRRKLERDPDRPRIVTSAHGRGYTVSVDIRHR